jgi:hypothetical protein
MSAYLLFIAVLMQPASAPTSAPTSQPSAAPASQPTKTAPAGQTSEDGKTIHRGAPFNLKKSMTMDALASKAADFKGKPVQVTGTVTNVCLKKGCWMVLGGKEKTARARITFKNYSFFVPLDCAGSKAIVEGVVELKVLSEPERQHLADDAGKKLADIPKHEMRLMASGVALSR